MVHQAKAYFNYRKNALKKGTTTSEFVTDLLVQVFDKKDTFYAFKAIEMVRESLKLNATKITVKDLGAGSKRANTNERSVRQLITASAKAPKYGQLLFRLANYIELTNAIELGTSLGITSAYLKKARREAHLFTLEGAPTIAALARKNFQLLNLKNITLIEGNFDDTLPPLLNRLKTVDFVFFDGNHTKEATLNYFNLCLAKIHDSTVFVFDDIYWSEGMTEAWEIIKEHHKVTVTIDVFELGIVFFKKGLPKEHLVIKY